MGRINVVLKKRLLDEINLEVKKEGTNRDTVIRAALEKYIEGKRREREEEETRRKMRDACRKMDTLASKLGKWDTQSTIRKFRDLKFKR